MNFYFLLKLLHILFGGFLISSMAYTTYLWYTNASAAKIQCQTWTFFIPLSLLQLIAGFTMISLKQEPATQLWIKMSMTGFILFILTWLTWIYFILSPQHQNKYKIQIFIFSLCTISLLFMIFFMANKIA